MKLFSTPHLVISAITFLLLFFMNYLGNGAPDKLYRALLTAGAGVVGLAIGLFILYKGKNDGTKPPEFD